MSVAMNWAAVATEPLLRLSYADEHVFLDAWKHVAVSGSLWVDGEAPRQTRVAVGLRIGGSEIEPLSAEVISREPAGFRLRVEPSPTLSKIVERALAVHRQGRRTSIALQTRREHERYSASLKIRLSSLPQLQHQYVANISRGGMFVSTDRPPQLGAAVRLTIELPGGEVVQVGAMVVHCEGGGVGLAFTEVSPDAFEPIERLLTRFSKQQPLVLLVQAPSRWRDDVVATLRAQGVTVNTAADAAAGLSALIAGLLQIDLLVIDLDDATIASSVLASRLRAEIHELGLRVMLLLGQPVAVEQVGVGKTWVASKHEAPEQLAARIRAQLGLTT